MTRVPRRRALANSDHFRSVSALRTEFGVVDMIFGKVGVSASPEDFARLAVEVAPYFALHRSVRRLRRRPMVFVSAVPPVGSSWRCLRYTSDFEPDRILYVDDSERYIVVAGESTRWRLQQVLRSIRHLLRWEAYASGALFLHAGLVRMDGLGVAFVGGKKAGKSTSIMSALLHGATHFVSNDDLVIAPGRLGELCGFGWPRALTLRRESLLALARQTPRAGLLLHELEHPTNARIEHETDRRQESHTTVPPAPLWVRISELAERLGCAVAPHSALDALVFPTFADTPTPSVEPLDVSNAGRLLVDNVERGGTKYDPFLAEWYPDTDKHRRADLLARVLKDVPCFRIVQNMEYMVDATEELRAVLRRSIPARKPAEA